MAKTSQEIDAIIKRSLNVCLEMNPGFKKTDTLVLVSYSVLKSIFINEKKHIILSAPTGTGKSVMAYLLHFCYHYCKFAIRSNNLPDVAKFDPFASGEQSYMLTSSKILQEQIDGDLDRFNLRDYFVMLKGLVNYECTKLTKETGTYHTYKERFCMGMAMSEKQLLPCFNTCPYIQTRYQAGETSCTVLNYSYYLNVLKSPHNPFFQMRGLTIADEAHLIPEIVQSQFNIELNQYQLLKINKIMNAIELNFPKLFGDELYNLQETLGECFQFFTVDKLNLEFIKAYIDAYKGLVRDLNAAFVKHSTNKVVEEMFKKDINELMVSLEYMDYDDYIDDLMMRPEDTFIKSEYIGNQQHKKTGALQEGSYRLFKHTVNDLSESAMCRKYFLSKVDTCIYMSATLGNIDDFAVLMGLEKDEYAGFRLQSNFDFSNSPIFVTNSGYLNYNNFNATIDKCLLDTLYISENLNAGLKGIIHTSTFQIANRLRDKILANQGGVTNAKRYLFYQTSEEKEACIELMKSETTTPYVIVGPSLYEGIDLRDDSGRFNIIVKAPYSGMDDYTKEKMLRYPFWYERTVLEKLEQAIGRTNRHVIDWSRTYLVDSVLNKLVFKLPEHITKRVKTIRI